MNKCFKQTFLAASLAFGFMAISGQANATISSPIVIDFEADTASGASLNAAVFPSFGQFYHEDGMIHSAIGFGTPAGSSIGNTIGGSSHIHGATIAGSRVSKLEADAGGGMFRADDGVSAFKLSGLDIAGLNLELNNNLGVPSGVTTTLTLRGYTSADYSTWLDITVGDDGAGNVVDAVGGVFGISAGANGESLDFSGVSEFGSLYLFEYWFSSVGRGNNPNTMPEANNLLVAFDNVGFDAPVTVPVPAAVYFFGTALLGLMSLRKKTIV